MTATMPTGQDSVVIAVRHRRLGSVFTDVRERSFLFQRVSVAI